VSIDFGDVSALATALGLLDSGGSIDVTWFTDPGGHVRGMLRNQPQRDALTSFIQAALGDQAAPVTDDPGRTWVPLLRLTGTDQAGSDLFLVLEPGARGVVVSIGVRVQAAAPVAASAEIRLPLLRVNQGASAGVTFLPGLDSADTGDTADATASLTGSVTVADTTLNSVGVTASVPLTFHDGQATGTPSVGIEVRGLRLPGSSEPLDVSLDSASAIGPELTHLLTAILQAEAVSATGAARDLLGLTGLLPAGGAIPPLPVGDILARGLPALAEWLQSVAADPAAMQAWVGLLADLIGATASAAGPPYGISLTAGRAQVDLTVDVRTDNAGGLVITPGASLAVITPLADVSEVSVAADVRLARISIGAHPGVQALPSLQLTARYGTDTGTIVNVTSPMVVTVGALHAGLGLDGGRRPVLVLGAERVDVGRDAAHLDHHDVLDLTSPDALADVGAEALDAIVAGMLAGLGPAGTAIEVLLGITPPASHAGDSAWPSVSPAGLVADPAGAVGAFLRDVVAGGGTGFADLLSVLPGLLGSSAAGAGPGTADQPWSLELADGVSLTAWAAGDPVVVHLGFRAAPAIPPLGGPGGPELGLAVVAEALAVTLPPATATSPPFPVKVTALPDLSLEITVSAPPGQPLTFGSGYQISLQEARLRLSWAPGGGLQASFDLPGATVMVAGVATPLEPITLGPSGRFTLPLDLPWDLVEQVAISALRSAAPDWVQGLPALLGADSAALDQAGGLSALISDPIRFLGGLLSAFLTGQDAAAFLATLASALAGLGSGPAGTGVTGGLVTGSGTPDDPYAVSVGTGAAAAQAVLWLDPAGPPPDLSALSSALRPESLGRWLDADAGAQALSLDTVAGLLGQAAAQVAGLEDLLAGRDTLAAGLDALAARVAGGDGLLPATAADVPGATAVALAGVTHPQLPASLDLAAVLGAAPDPATLVYVTGPLEPPWPGLDDRTFDLTQPGLAATGFDVSRATSEDGPWHVRLAARAACPGTDASSQLQAQTARLQQVADAVASRHPGQVVLVAHGSAGQAARLLASQDAGVARLVLLGVPAAGLSLDVLDVPPAADVLPLLRRLLPAPDPGQPDDPNLATGRAVLATLGGAFDSALAPVNDFLPPQALGSLTPPVFSVRGALDPDTTARGLAAVIRAGLDAAWPTASAPRPAPTALRGGLRMTASSAPATAGPGPAGVAVSVAAALDLGLLSLTGGAPLPPAMSLTVTLSRPGGWLAGGPQGVPAPPDLSRTPSLRRAEFRVSADLAAPAASAAPAVRARIVLSEVNALSLVADQLVLGDGGGPVTPEARVLLGRLADTLGPAPDGSQLAGVVQLLAAAGLTDPSVAAPAVGLSVDAITRLAADPAGQLRGALAAAPARAAAAAALRSVFADTASTGTQAALALGGITLAVDLSAPTSSVRVSTAPAGLDLPGGLTLILDTTVSAQGQWGGSAALAPGGTAGPAGRPALRIMAGSGSAGPTVGVHIDGGLAGLPADLPLWPLPSGSSVAGMLPVAAALFAGQLAGDLLAAVRALDPAHLDPVLGYLGLLDGTGTSAQVRLPAGLVADPGGWLARSLAPSGIDPDRIAGLVDAVRELAGLPDAAHGTLPLPLGIQLTAGPGPAGQLQVTLAADGNAGDLHLVLSGGVTVPPGAPLLPALSVAAGPAGSSAALQLGLNGPDLTAALRLSNGSTVQIYPSGPGLGSLAAAATAALPLVLDQLEAHGPGPVPAALTSVRTVLSLGAATFDAAQLQQLAADPAGELQRRLAANGPGALGRLAPLVRPALPPGWTVDTTSDPQAVTLSIGTGSTRLQLVLRFSMMPAAFSADVTAGFELDAAGLGITGTAQVTVDGTGLRMAGLSTGIDPAAPLTIGGAAIAPFTGFTAGSDAPGGARAEAGIAVTASGHVHALVATLLLGPPLTVSGGTRTDGQPDGAPDIAAIVTGFIIPALADVALADSSVTAVLDRPALGAVTVGELLQDVLLTSGGQFDPGALDLSQALQRLLQLGANVANADPSVTIGDHLTLEIAHVTHGPTTTYGVGVTVDPGQSVPLTSGDIVLAVEVDSTWTDILGSASPGLSVLLLDHTSGGYRIAASPAVLVNGVGMRISRSSGPLLDTGLQIGSVALYGLLDIDGQGVQASGGKLELAGLAVAVAGAAGGDNAVAQGILGDAASGGAGGSGDNTLLQPQFSPALALEKPASGPLTWSLRAGDGNGPWWIQIQRSFGPLHVEQIGFGVDQDGSAVHGLRVLFDGGLSMLGLSIDVEELSVGAQWPAARQDKALTDPHAWSIDLAGLAVGYSGGSVSLAGALRKSGSPPDYLGVLIAHIGPYGLTAFGGYGQFLAPDGSRYTSLFVVAGITAPIGGPPAFFVTGLGGGAGINRQLVLPATLDDFPSYPLVAAIDPHSTLATDPQHALDELSAAFPPQRGNFWFAAGVSFTSFALVDVTAVVAVSVGDGFQVALLGLGRMALPTTYAPLVEVELALQARFSTKEGALVVQAQLTQNSWILTPDCRLTGGFAYASFFGANPNAGQFVLSIGGYHPSFHHDGYPAVPRVGYVWSVASSLTISGQSYFALTSEAIMAGTRFTAALDLGFLWASLTLGVDAIVYFDPFEFSADGYASIAAGVTVDIDLGWFGSIEVSLSFHLGATVHVQGPDFHGSATIDLDVTSATIAFGSSTDNSTQQLSWPDFSAKYLTAGGSGTLSAMPQLGQVTGTPTTSAGTTPTGDADKPWKFVAEWSLSVTSTAAATQLQLPATMLSYGLSEVPGIASMAIDALTSTMTVTVAGSAGGDASPPILGPGDPGEGLRVELVTAPLPKGVWTANPNAGTVPSGDTITAGTGFVLQAGATVEGATPAISANQIGPLKARKPLPFAQETAARPGRQPDDTNAAAFAAAQPQSPGAALDAALAFLTGGPEGSKPTPMGALAFRRDRVAPPRLGLLTEGMVSPQTPAPVITPIATPPPPVVDSSLHPPVLVGILRGGPAPAQRPVLRTSVAATASAAASAAADAVRAGPAATPPAAAAPIPRVPAPTLASVAARSDPAFAAALALQAPTAQVAATGLRAADGGPVSLRAATPGELRAGPGATAGQRTLLDGSHQDLLAKGLTVRPGDLILAEMPNAARDLDATAPRHTVSVQGNAAVRVVALTVTGQVLLDAAGLQLTVTIPQHAARVALWCVGGDGTRPAGLAGWADLSRLPQVGSRTLLAADAVVNGAASARRGPAAVSAATVPAAAAVQDSGFVTTLLPADTRTVVVSVDPAGDDRDLTGLTLGLDGAARAAGADGTPTPPTVVTAGARMHLLYPVVPSAGVEVTVGTDARWRLAGVLGGPADVATSAAQLAAQGAAAAVAPLVRAPAGSARVMWSIPSEVS
jgi:large repetitive protein